MLMSMRGIHHGVIVGRVNHAPWVHVQIVGLSIAIAREPRLDTIVIGAIMPIMAMWMPCSTIPKLLLGRIPVGSSVVAV
jgi:hypothetical protein